MNNRLFIIAGVLLLLLPLDSIVQAQPASSIETNNLADVQRRYQQGLIDKGQAIQEVLIARNKRSLDMYGLVVDQHNEPVAGAKVRGGVQLNISPVKTGGIWHETE